MSEGRTQKRCPICHNTKPLSEYWKDRYSADDAVYACKECLRPIVRERFKRWYYSGGREYRKRKAAERAAHREHKEGTE